MREGCCALPAPVVQARNRGGGAAMRAAKVARRLVLRRWGAGAGHPELRWRADARNRWDVNAPRAALVICDSRVGGWCCRARGLRIPKGAA
eukprot:1610391-Prymnesium_polylepis.1